MAKYGKKAQKKVRKTMRERKRGTLRAECDRRDRTERDDHGQQPGDEQHACQAACAGHDGLTVLSLHADDGGCGIELVEQRI